MFISTVKPEHLRIRQNIHLSGVSGLKGLFMQDKIEFGPEAMFGIKRIPVWEVHFRGDFCIEGVQYRGDFCIEGGPV